MFSHGRWISGHFHRLAHQLRVVEDVVQLRITLEKKKKEMNFMNHEYRKLRIFHC